MTSNRRPIQVPPKSPRRVGIVESAKRDKTRTVVLPFVARHPKYGKYVRKRMRLHVHDERNESKLGDRVEVAECRPISRTKSWILLRVVERAVEPAEPIFTEEGSR